ncbi:unnamed protein product [Polarella glacialis]|uniref:Peroxin-7 n=1 Tax=Polarella glacialis TaxID=89957 RepID=A0A813J5T5_POLGL|nr:unnamed protein product [Polarella glacialis]
MGKASDLPARQRSRSPPTTTAPTTTATTTTTTPSAKEGIIEVRALSGALVAELALGDLGVGSTILTLKLRLREGTGAPVAEQNILPIFKLALDLCEAGSALKDCQLLGELFPTSCSPRLLLMTVRSKCQLALAGGVDGSLNLWDLQSGAFRKSDGHTGKILGILADWRGERALSWCSDQRAVLWDLAPAGSIQSWILDSPRGILAIHSDWPRDRAIARCSDFSLRIWEGLKLGQVAGQSFKAAKELTGHTDRVTGLQVSWSVSRALSSSHDGSVRHWDVNSGLCLQVLKCHNSNNSNNNNSNNNNSNSNNNVSYPLAGVRADWAGAYALGFGQARLQLWALGVGGEYASCRADFFHSCPQPPLPNEEEDFDGVNLSSFTEHTLQGVEVDWRDEHRIQVLTWGSDQKIRLWNLDASLEDAHAKSHLDPVQELHVQDGNFLEVQVDWERGRALSWSWGDAPQLWDLSLGTVLLSFPVRCHVMGLEVHWEGGRCLARSFGGGLFLWHFLGGNSRLAELKAVRRDASAVQGMQVDWQGQRALS